MPAKSQPLRSANPTKAKVLPFPSLLTGVLRERPVISKFLRPFCSEQRDREAWGELTNPRENDQNKTQTAQSRKVNNYKDLYGNLDNKLKKIFTRKSSQ